MPPGGATAHSTTQPLPPQVTSGQVGPGTRSVEVLAASARAARARDLVLLDGELVVVSELLAARDAAQREDDDVLLTQDVNHTGVTVGLPKQGRASAAAGTVGTI